MRDMQDADLYLFSMAGAGPVVKSLLKQRKARCAPVLSRHLPAPVACIALPSCSWIPHQLPPCLPAKTICSVSITAPVELSHINVQDFVTGLRRKRYPEVFLREVEKRRPLASAVVDQRFLIRDLIGTNTLTQQQTTSGPLLRLTPRH